MVGDGERMARAGRYVLGRMSAGERERAERDLEQDAEFRLAVIAMAERMRRIRGAGGDPSEAAWTGLAERLAALPHMQGSALPGIGTAPFRDEPAEPEKFSWTRGLPLALRRRAARLWRVLLGRGGVAQGIAILEAATGGTAALVEAGGSGRLRLLLLQDFSLRADERLSLWAHDGDGAYRRLAGFAPQAEIGLKGTDASGPGTGFALARERIAPLPSSRLRQPPLAEGRLRPLLGQDGAKARREEGDGAEPRPAGRKGIPN